MRRFVDRDEYRFFHKDCGIAFDYMGSLFINEFSTLVLGDVHLGKDVLFMSQASTVPAVSQYTVHTIFKAVNRYLPRTIVLNGDVFHSSRLSDFHFLVDHLSKISGSAKIVTIRGNHDTEKKRKKREHYDFDRLILKIDGKLYPPKPIIYKVEPIFVEYLDVGPFRIQHDLKSDFQHQMMAQSRASFMDTDTLYHSSLIRSDKGTGENATY